MALLERVHPRVVADPGLRAAVQNAAEVAAGVIDVQHHGSASTAAELRELECVLVDLLTNALLGVPVG